MHCICMRDRQGFQKGCKGDAQRCTAVHKGCKHPNHHNKECREAVLEIPRGCTKDAPELYEEGGMHRRCTRRHKRCMRDARVGSTVDVQG